MTPRCLVRQIADAGGRIWLNGESVRIAANGPLPNAIVEQLRRNKPGVVEVLRLLPVCCECGANVLGPAIAWWGARPVHLDCRKRAWRREWKGAALSAGAPGGTLIQPVAAKGRQTHLEKYKNAI